MTGWIVAGVLYVLGVTTIAGILMNTKGIDLPTGKDWWEAVRWPYHAAKGIVVGIWEEVRS